MRSPNWHRRALLYANVSIAAAVWLILLQIAFFAVITRSGGNGPAGIVISVMFLTGPPSIGMPSIIFGVLLLVGATGTRNGQPWAPVTIQIYSWMMLGMMAVSLVFIAAQADQGRSFPALPYFLGGFIWTAHCVWGLIVARSTRMALVAKRGQVGQGDVVGSA